MFRFLTLVVLLLAAPVPATADRYQDCAQLADAERSIRGCTLIIKRGTRESRRNRAIAYLNRGNAYDNKGQHDHAIADYDQAIKLNPRDASAYFNRGLAYRRKGDNDRAIADCDEAIKLNPRYAKAYLNRGLAYWKQGDNDRAITDYAKVIKLNPRHANAYFNRGLAYYNKSDFGQAIRDYTSAIKLDPRDAKTYYNRGIAYFSNGDHQQAIADFTRAIKLKPRFFEAYYNRGIAYSSKGDNDGAIADYRKVLSLKPNHSRAKDALKRLAQTPSNLKTLVNYKNYLTASFLNRLCRGKISGTFFRTEIGARQYCQGYVSAVAEAYEQGNAKGGWHYCLKSETSAKDVLQTFREFGKNRAKWGQFPAVSGVSHALQDKYPCTSSKLSMQRTIVSTKSLYDICYHLDTERTAGYCYGYFQGVIEALDQWSEVRGKRFCIGENLPKLSYRPDKRIDHAALEVKSNFLAEVYVDLGPELKPGALHYVVSALARVYPCDAK